MRERDPQRVTDQDALTVSSGGIWLVLGGVTAVIAIVMLVALRDLRPAGAATTGLVAVTTCYLAMVVVRYGVPHGRLRLGLLAALMIALFLAFAICVGTMVVVESTVPLPA